MTDDLFLPKPGSEGMRPAEPSAQPAAFEPAASPPSPSDVVPAQAPPAPPAQLASGAPEYYQPQALQVPPPPVYGEPGQQVQPGQYPVPYAPYPPTAYAQQSKPKTWMNWVAFGCGLGALFTCVSFIPAIIFGHMGLAAANRGEADAKGPGIAGLVIGYVFAVGAIAYIVLIVGVFTAGF